MPTMSYQRDQGWLLPRALGELVPVGHLARFIAKVIDQLDGPTRQGLGLNRIHQRGAPSYPATALLCAWVYGFQVGIRSTRQLSLACREWVPLMWLVGEKQPDHVTLWRFYKERPDAMRELLRRTVFAAVSGGLLDTSLQVVDGTKVQASAARSQMKDEAELAELEQRLTEAIAELEARAEAEQREDTVAVRVASKLRVTKDKRDRTRAALERLRPPAPGTTGSAAGQEEDPNRDDAGHEVATPPVVSGGTDNEPGGAVTPTAHQAIGSRADTDRGAGAAAPATTPAETFDGADAETPDAGAGKKAKKRPPTPRVNLTDPDATLVKGRHNQIVPGYNAEIAAVGLAEGVLPGERGHFIVGSYVTTAANDVAELLPLLDDATALTGMRAPLTLADSGFHSGSNLAGADERGQTVWMPDSRDTDDPYHKDRFVYEPETDTFRCPEGKTLRRAGVMTRTRNQPDGIRYAASLKDCKACPVFARCAGTTRGRSIVLGPYDDRLKQHRATMRDPSTQKQCKERKWRVEPIFGRIKELQRGRTFLRRGLKNVTSEWMLHVVAFNLKTLYRIWRSRAGAAQDEFMATLSKGMNAYGAATAS